MWITYNVYCPSKSQHTIFTENPTTVPGVDEKQACVDTTNIHFAYESSENLDEILHRQYGQVTWQSVVFDC